MNFDYFYNRQSEMYNFIRLPMVLMEDVIFESISIEAKVLYSHMLNRMDLSYKNGWIDEDEKFLFTPQWMLLKSNLTVPMIKP